MPLPRPLLVGLFSLLLAAPLGAATVSGAVADSSGSLVPGARVEIQGEEPAQPVFTVTDAQGRFVFPDLKPGVYRMQVSAKGFGAFAKTLEVGGTAITLQIKLEVATEREEITVSGGANGYANSDPVYRQLRNVTLGESIRFEGFTLTNDVAAFYFQEGTLTFLAPVNARVTGAIFIGKGHFTLKAFTSIDQRELLRRAHAETVEEDFDEAVFRFNGQANLAFLQGSKGRVTTPPAEAAKALERWEDKVRRRRELPTSSSEEFLSGPEMDNIDAELLASVYNPVRPSFFGAYLHGVKRKDLRFLVRDRGGAIPAIGTAEEVALVNCDPLSLDDGVWYLAHRKGEYQSGKASSLEERRYVAAKKFKVETAIGNNDHLTSVATVTLSPLVAGERVIRFQLLPNLRVNRVTDTTGMELHYIQESRKADGSFYVILPAAAELGAEYAVTIEYAGDKVVTKAGNGSFYIGAREAWYPNLNDFSERAFYDLTYKVPKRYHVISAGTLEKEWTEDKFSASHWVSEQPLAVAGFNYGEYKKMELADEGTGYKLEGYYLPEIPDILAHRVENMQPGAMTKYVLEQARAQLQLCTYYFGRAPYGHLYVTEQPNFAFGQSWPNLVYLPISAYLDSTQRWMLFNTIDNKFQAFVDEVTPHEVAHQWWGHAVGWASYHDQWLSEGFAEFSAALFTQQAISEKDWRKDYTQFWERLRKQILEKNNFGTAPNDAGPIWMGLRLDSPRSEGAYQQVIYPKGAYILEMLRSLMYTNQDKDKAFIEMMHDFVASHKDTPASTESFKAVAEKHMSRVMDLRGDGKLDWFFNEWVYGTTVPRYQFEYQLSPGVNGKTKLHLKITQSDVDQSFGMLVPLFGDVGKGMIRMGQLPIVGNSSQTFDIEVPFEPKKLALNAYKEILER